MKLITNITAIGAVALLLAVTGCARETNSETRADVAETQAEDAENVNSAHMEGADEMTEAGMHTTDMDRDVTHDAADSAMH